MFARKLLLALTLIPPFFSLWWLGTPYFSALMVIFAAVAAYEVVTMGSAAGRSVGVWIAVPGAALIAASAAFPFPIPAAQLILFALLLLLLAHMFFPGDMSSVASRLGVSTLAVLYAGLPISYLIMLRDTPDHGRTLSLLTLAISWLCDTFAYFGGRVFGKHKLYPKMSPNKTIEGLFSGMLAAGIGAAVMAYVGDLPWSPLWVGVLGFVGGGVGQLGDLCESMMKRSFGVKDSGSLLRSHGGVLDRFDAVLFVAPLVYFAWQWSR